MTRPKMNKELEEAADLIAEGLSDYIKNHSDLADLSPDVIAGKYIASLASEKLDDPNSKFRKEKVYNAERVLKAIKDYPELQNSVYSGWLSPEQKETFEQVIENLKRDVKLEKETRTAKESQIEQAEKARKLQEEKLGAIRSQLEQAESARQAAADTRNMVLDDLDKVKKEKEFAEAEFKKLSTDPEYRKMKDAFGSYGNYEKAVKAIKEKNEENINNSKELVNTAKVLKAKEEKHTKEEAELSEKLKSYSEIRNNFEDEKEKYMAKLIDLGQKEGDLYKRENELGQKDAEYKALFSEKARIEQAAKSLMNVEAKQTEEWKSLNGKKSELEAEKAKLAEQAQEVMRLRGEIEAQYAQLEGLAAEFGKLPDPMKGINEIMVYLGETAAPVISGKKTKEDLMYRDWEGGYVQVDEKCDSDIQEDAWGLAEMLLERVKTKEAEEAKYSFKDFVTAEKKTVSGPNDASNIITSIENYFMEIKDAEAEFDRNNCANACDNLTWAFKLEKDIRADIMAYYERRKKEEDEKRKKNTSQAEALKGVADKLGIK